jgi:hypothetical protein
VPRRKHTYFGIGVCFGNCPEHWRYQYRIAYAPQLHNKNLHEILLFFVLYLLSIFNLRPTIGLSKWSM